jgi:hypothetical protein
MRRIRVTSRQLAAATAAVSALVWTCLFVAGPAAASCAVPAKASPYRFAGVVLSTDNDGRTATVLTDEGRTVTVVGAEGGLRTITSIDRTYRVNMTYEFHPLNNANPYRDNACTATRELGVRSAPDAIGEAGPGRPPDAPSGWLLPGAVLVASLALGVVLMRRTASRRRSVGAAESLDRGDGVAHTG